MSLIFNGLGVPPQFHRQKRTIFSGQGGAANAGFLLAGTVIFRMASPVDKGFGRAFVPLSSIYQCAPTEGYSLHGPSWPGGWLRRESERLRHALQSGFHFTLWAGRAYWHFQQHHLARFGGLPGLKIQTWGTRL
jgi:hypothetical protein